jgi:hypothetical protein
MAGGAIIVIAFFFGLAGGIIGRLKGSSFFVWFLISACIPFFGLAAAVLYRYETLEPEKQCPRCGKTVKLYEALCTRCGTELNPGYTEESSPAVHGPEPA